MSHKEGLSPNKRSFTTTNEIEYGTSSSTSFSSPSVSASDINRTESTPTNIPTYDIHDVIYVVANVGYKREVKRFALVSSDHYHDERLLLPLQYVPYGVNNLTLFQVACVVNHIDRVKELLRYNADPDLVYISPLILSKTLSGLAEAVVRGHYEIVQYLMTYYYEPKFRNWEVWHHHITPGNIPVTEPTPKNQNNKWYQYFIPSPTNINNCLFASIYPLKFYDDTLSKCNLPLHVEGHWDADTITPNMIKAFHALLYKSIPNLNTNSNLASSSLTVYSCFWKSVVAKLWLPHLVGWMIMCKEPHTIDTIVSAWKEVLPILKYTSRGIPFYAALSINNIPLFRTLADRLGTSTEDRRYMFHAIACYGTVDLLREYHKYIKNIDKANPKVERYKAEVYSALSGIGTYALDNPDPFAILTYLRDNVPSYARVWDVSTIEKAATYGRLDIMKFLREVDPPCDWDDFTATCAAIDGHMHILQWLKNHDPPCPMSADTYWSARDDKVRQWLKDNGCPSEFEAEKVERDDDEEEEEDEEEDDDEDDEEDDEEEDDDDKEKDDDEVDEEEVGSEDYYSD